MCLLCEMYKFSLYCLWGYFVVVVGWWLVLWHMKYGTDYEYEKQFSSGKILITLLRWGKHKKRNIIHSVPEWDSSCWWYCHGKKKVCLCMNFKCATYKYMYTLTHTHTQNKYLLYNFYFKMYYITIFMT